MVGFVEDKKTLPESTSGRKKDLIFTIMIDPFENDKIQEVWLFSERIEEEDEFWNSVSK